MNTRSRLRMGDRRDAADREARGGAHGIGVGAADALTAERGQAALVGLVRPRHQHEDGLVTGQEHQGLHDLPHRHAARRRRLGGGPGALREHDHLARHPVRLERRADAGRRRRRHARSSGRNRRAGWDRVPREPAVAAEIDPAPGEAHALALQEETLAERAAAVATRADRPLPVHDAVPRHAGRADPHGLPHRARGARRSHERRHLTIGHDATARHAAHQCIHPLSEPARHARAAVSVVRPSPGASGPNWSSHSVR